jgi:hypothetical protein
MDYVVVVSNDNNDVEWTNEFNNLKIYNHENEFISYLNYIIEHYEELPSYIILVKGNPFTSNKYITKVNVKKQVEVLLSNLYGEQTCDAIPFFNKPTTEQQYAYPGIRAPEYYCKFFEGDIPTMFEFNNQNQYILSKIGIVNRDKTFYENLRQMLLKNKILNYDEAHYTNRTYYNDSINPWVLQRIFPYIFDTNVKTNAI